MMLTVGMVISKLFEKIRKEEVALFVGSGCSLYAGYPSATDLRAKILSAVLSYCNQNEKSLLENLNLEELAEQLIRLNRSSRVELNKILISEFGKPACDTSMHDLLSRIPHFEHIFTTNYDQLIENSMQNRCHVIRSEYDFSYQTSKLPKIYKIHGDILLPDTMVIAKGDYSRSISALKDSLLWNRLRDVIASKDILFLGYGYEDSNLWEIFENIKERIGGNSRQKFLISPRLPDFKKDYLTANGFHYFDSTAECFLNKLYSVLQDFAVADLERGHLSPSTFNRFLSFNDRAAIVRSTEENVKVEAIMDRNGYVHTEINLTVEKKIYDEVIKFNTGEIYRKSLKLSKDDLVKFDFKQSGFKMPTDEHSIVSLEILRIPVKRGLSIESADGVLLLEGIESEHYGYNRSLDFEFALYGARIDFKLIPSKRSIDVKFGFKMPKSFSTVSQALQVFRFLKYLSEGRHLNFYFQGMSKPLQMKSNKVTGACKWNVSTFVNHYERLRWIETQKSVRFTDLSETISEEEVENVGFYYDMLKEGFVDIDFKKFIVLPEEVTHYNSKINEVPANVPDTSFLLILEQPQVYKFHGHKFDEFFLMLEIKDFEILHHNERTFLKSKSESARYRMMTKENYRSWTLDSYKVKTSELKS